jgi:hypothetical protein
MPRKKEMLEFIQQREGKDGFPEFDLAGTMRYINVGK